jgi:hypothetical protein
LSNIIDNDDKDPILDAAGDLREDVVGVVDEPSTVPNPNPLASFVKPKVHFSPEETQELEGVFTNEQLIALTKVVERNTRKVIEESTYDASMPGQVIDKSKVPITDFSNLTMDSVYDLNIPIIAKEFMSADALTIKLRDTNYEPRWVNKMPQNLGDKIAKGFTYVTPNDLLQGTEEAIKASRDSQGHYVFYDVVAMKIDKATYYAALRAAHLRAINTTNEVMARKRAAKSANAFMQNSDVAADYNNAAAQRKMVFYDPGIGV